MVSNRGASLSWYRTVDGHKGRKTKPNRKQNIMCKRSIQNAENQNTVMGHLSSIVLRLTSQLLCRKNRLLFAISAVSVFHTLRVIMVFNGHLINQGSSCAEVNMHFISIVAICLGHQVMMHTVSIPSVILKGYY